jgi:hypothetical protein
LFITEGKVRYIMVYDMVVMFLIIVTVPVNFRENIIIVLFASLSTLYSSTLSVSVAKQKITHFLIFILF